jgi:hypothetical protein
VKDVVVNVKKLTLNGSVGDWANKYTLTPFTFGITSEMRIMLGYPPDGAEFWALYIDGEILDPASVVPLGEPFVTVYSIFEDVSRLGIALFENQNDTNSLTVLKFEEREPIGDVRRGYLK